MAITFDDGYSDNFVYARPLLRAAGTPATFFVTVGLLERDRAVIERMKTLRGTGEEEVRGMDWHEVRELQSSGFAIGSHTYSHRNLALLTAQEAAADIYRAKALLEDRLEASSRLFAYPFGKPGRHFTRDTIGVVDSAGYTTAAAVLFRRVKPTDDPLAIPRFFVGNDDLKTLEAKVRGRWDVVGAFQERLPQFLARRVSPTDFAYE